MSDAGWTTLGSLKPGTLFETEEGERGVKSIWMDGATWLADGRYQCRGVTTRVRPLLLAGEPPPLDSPLMVWLLGLTADERGLIRALAERPTDATAIAALSDLLKEKGCEEDGAAMAEGWKERLMGLIGGYGSANFDAGYRMSGGRTSPDIRLAEDEVQRRLAAIRRLIGLDKAEE